MKLRCTLLFSAALIAGALSACDSGSGQAASAGGSDQISNATPTNSSGNTNPGDSTKTDPSPTSGQYQSCVSSDPNHSCIGLKVVSYKDSSGTAILSENDAKTLIQSVNNLLQPCNVAFQIEAYDAVNPSDYSLQYGAESQNELTQIRQIFSTNDQFLLALTGAWNTSTIAWTEMPGAPPYGAVVDSDYAKDPITVAHELGHYLGLDHDSNVGNLMYYIVYPQDTALTAAQCEQVQQTISGYWQGMLRH